MRAMARICPVASLIVLLSLPAPAHGQECQERTERPWLGVGTFACDGGVCAVHGAVVKSTRLGAPATQLKDRALQYDFSVEPSLWDIAPEGPAASKLEEGDVLVAVNGRVVTSVAASRELDRLATGEPVRLTVRREGRLIDVTVTPVTSCEAIWVTSRARVRQLLADRRAVQRGHRSGSREGQIVLRADRSAARRATASAWHSTVPGFLGVALRCGKCVLSLGAEPGRSTFRFEEYPEVARVVEGSHADRAGLQPGDVLTHIDGEDLLTREGGLRLADLIVREGERVEIRFRRGGEARSVTVSFDDAD